MTNSARNERQTEYIPVEREHPMAAITRRRFVAKVGAAMALSPSVAEGSEPGKQVETITISESDLKAIFRDNAQSPKTLSGVDSLFNTRHAPDFDAFDPDGQGASAGLNFEHIISGHKNANNAFTPRNGKFSLYSLANGRSVLLERRREDDPWAMSSSLKYALAKPHYIDVDFRCIPHNKQLFGARGYAVLFFADYMNNVADVALHFRGVEGPGAQEKWIAGDAPKGHPDWNGGGTYRSLAAAGLEYDKDHNFKLNSWSYDWPRFTKPFYYGRAAQGMVFILMFNKMYSGEDEIRFSLFKFKLPRHPRPAWDFQYVIRNIQEGKQYGFKARLVWKKFVSAEDCLKEYEDWKASLDR
jgi:hypothetical protein